MRRPTLLADNQSSTHPVGCRAARRANASYCPLASVRSGRRAREGRKHRAALDVVGGHVLEPGLTS